MSHTAHIENRRLEELEIQAALHGPNTEPAILIEIADLRGKVRATRGDQRGSFVNSLDFDLVRTSVAAALVRIGMIELNQSHDKATRHWRQLVHDFWMVMITVMVFVTLILVLIGR